jgi:glycosyltransferase involved in cell wall biosynthesis
MMKYGEVGVFSAFKWNHNGISIPGVSLWQHYNVGKPLSLPEKWQRRLWWVRQKGHSDVDWTYAIAGAQELDSLLTKFQPQVVIFEELWLYRYLDVVKRHGCQVIFDNHNVEASLAEQKHRHLTDFKSKLKANIQLAHLKTIERDFIHQANQVWVCSDDDARLLQKLYGASSNIQTIPNAINVSQYDSVRLGECTLPTDIPPAPKTLIFVGLLSYAPNTEAAQLLINQIFPHLQAIYPDCRLLLVGRNPTRFMQQAAKENPGIIVTGAVVDVLPYLAAASIVVVPLLQGGGTRLKLLEAFASCRSVVTTTKGAEGLNVQDGKHLLIRNDIAEIVAGICQLWQDAALRGKLTNAAYKLVQEQYSWEVVGKKVEEVTRLL